MVFAGPGLRLYRAAAGACCVLLAAQEHAGTVASFDSDLLAAARKLGLKTTG